MQHIRRSSERGHFNHGWLDTYHTFSFGDYHDPDHMGFRSLRVINEDRVAPGQGFGMHPHRDMEIITYVLSGQLEHRDSLGTGSVIGPGELQHMRAGTGIMHSEFNPSPIEPVHLYQIWLLPERRGLTPSYEQKLFPAGERRAGWQCVASKTDTIGTLPLHSDVKIYLSYLDESVNRSYEFRNGRHGWLQVLRGKVTANGSKLAAGDALSVSEEPALALRADAAAEVMLFDLA
jgi:redox-sensitive bicupin YhaK (pirin superfamily)